MEKDKKDKKKMNIVLYTIIMLVVFVAITELIIWGYGSGLIIKAVSNYPKGYLVISEAVLASLVLIVMLLFKNSYVFTQKHEKFMKGIFYGLFYIVGAGFFTLFGVISGALSGGLALLNLIIGCFFIGVAEEFLCRGWLLNEFLERYGDTKKGVWYSIVISGVIFGLMHLGNIYTMGQAIPTTIIQVLSASATGIVFGLIYYKTKNIWSVVALHGLWDFSLLLQEIAPVTTVNETIPGFSVFSLFFSVLMVGAELVNLIPHAKDIDSEPKKEHVVACAFAGFGFFLLFTLISGLFSIDFGDAYKYDSINIEHYAVTRDNYEDYYMKYKPSFDSEEYSFKLTKKDKNLVLTNLNTNESVTIKCDSLYDYIIMEKNEYYIIGYVDYTNSANPFLYYTFLNRNELSNDKTFLDTFSERFSKYLLSDKSELLVLSDYEKNDSYLAAYSEDYGYYVLIADNKMSILNRD